VGEVEKGKLKTKKSQQRKRIITEENMYPLVRGAHKDKVRVAFCRDEKEVTAEYYQTSDLRLFKSFVSKCSWPIEIYIHHDKDESKQCLDWMIKVCDCLKRWMPDVNISDEGMAKEVSKYCKLQMRIQKRRKKPHFR